MHTLSTVLVTGNRYREVIPSQTLQGKRLESLSALSVADALRYFSGMQIKDYGGIGGLKTVDVRSMGSSHTGVFYDGVQIGNAQNGQVDLGRFSLDNIEEISLYNGQRSEIFQSAKDFASSSAVYMRTRIPTFTENKKTNIKAVFRCGSFGLANPSVLWEQKINKNISSSLGAEYIYATGKYKFRYRQVLPDGQIAWDTSGIRQNGDINSLRVEGGLNGVIRQGKWDAKVYMYNSEKGIPGAVVNNVFKRAQRQWDRDIFVQGSFQKQLFKNYDIKATAKYANNYLCYLQPDSTEPMKGYSEFWQQEMYVSVINKYAVFKNWDIVLSTDYQFNLLDASVKQFALPRRNSLLAALATAFEYKHFKMQASLLATFIFDNLKSRQQRNNKKAFSPAVFLSYQPFAQVPFSFHTYYKRSFRMPTFNDLYYTEIGNSALRPENTEQFDLGVLYEAEFKRGIVSSTRIGADAYYNKVTDKIVAIPKGSGQFRWMMMNIGLAKIIGVDVSAQAVWKLPADIFINTGITYTFQRARDFSNPKDNEPVYGSYGGQIAYIPLHSGSVTAGLNWRGWSMDYSFIYVGERYHTSANTPDNYEQPWYTHDLSLGKSFKIKMLRFKISAELNNMLNQYYDVIRSYPMPGINGKVVLKIEF
ncbi:MAG: TonB-dependent receptor plug domain-containing protein [Prevotellaceae bacterium]|nr:TonB-dependent receptor plug domain-containing protein [Prevotellaceae bacterium]